MFKHCWFEGENNDRSNIRYKALFPHQFPPEFHVDIRVYKCKYATVVLMERLGKLSKETTVEKQLESWLSIQPAIHFAILFGSFAKQTGTPTSDIDIAIELDEPLSVELKLDFLKSLGEKTDRKIDLVDLKKVGEPLLNQILQYGKVLKGEKSDLIKLSIKNINMMQDFAPYLKRTLKERRKRLLHG